MNREKQVDRRITRTKNVIREALISLIEEKGFDAILISDIAQKADINRGTFYLHYQDKFDLLDKTLKEIIESMQRIVFQVNNLNISDFNDAEKPLPMIIQIFEYLKENANLMHAIFHLEGGYRFQALLRKTIETNIKLESVAGLSEKNFMIPSHYLISYAISAHFGVIQDWLNRGCIESPAEMAVILSKISWLGVIRSAGFFNIK